MDVMNKIVVAAGASSGIGLATAKLLTERGAKLALIFPLKRKVKNDNIIVSVVYPYITYTSFGRNTVIEPHEGKRPPEGNAIPGDTAEYAAQKMLIPLYLPAIF